MALWMRLLVFLAPAIVHRAGDSCGFFHGPSSTNGLGLEWKEEHLYALHRAQKAEHVVLELSSTRM
jgi:hypothetical protein